LEMSSCESIPTAFSMASTAKPVAWPVGELLNRTRTLPSQPAALAAATYCLAAAGSYFGPGTFGYHLKVFCRSSDPGWPWPLKARWSITLGSMAAATALRTLRSFVGGFVCVGPSGFPAQIAAGWPPAQLTVRPVFIRRTPPAWAVDRKPGMLAALAA